MAATRSLEMLSLRDTAVTADAMPCWLQVAQRLAEPGGDYASARKGNQGPIHDDVTLFLDDSDTPIAQATQFIKGIGRIEIRVAGRKRSRNETEMSWK